MNKNDVAEIVHGAVWRLIIGTLIAVIIFVLLFAKDFGWVDEWSFNEDGVQTIDDRSGE